MYLKQFQFQFHIVFLKTETGTTIAETTSIKRTTDAATTVGETTTHAAKTETSTTIAGTTPIKSTTDAATTVGRTTTHAATTGGTDKSIRAIHNKCAANGCSCQSDVGRQLYYNRL